VFGNLASNRKAASSMTIKDTPAKPLQVIEGNREALERELLWSIVFDHDPVRRDSLRRMLIPAANHAVMLVPGVGGAAGIKDEINSED
jgi:hypothetical protein